jgi:plasmid stabilization system protein ParE
MMSGQQTSLTVIHSGANRKSKLGNCQEVYGRSDCAEEWQRYKDEVAAVNKRAGDDPKAEDVNAEVHYRIEMVAYRDKLDLYKPADRLTAHAKVFQEDPGLYERYRAGKTERSLPLE